MAMEGTTVQDVGCLQFNLLASNGAAHRSKGQHGQDEGCISGTLGVRAAHACMVSPALYDEASALATVKMPDGLTPTPYA